MHCLYLVTFLHKVSLDRLWLHIRFVITLSKFVIYIHTDHKCMCIFCLCLVRLLQLVDMHRQWAHNNIIIILITSVYALYVFGEIAIQSIFRFKVIAYIFIKTLGNVVIYIHTVHKCNCILCLCLVRLL